MDRTASFQIHVLRHKSPDIISMLERAKLFCCSINFQHIGRILFYTYHSIQSVKGFIKFDLDLQSLVQYFTALCKSVSCDIILMGCLTIQHSQFADKNDDDKDLYYWEVLLHKCVHMRVNETRQGRIM